MHAATTRETTDRPCKWPTRIRRLVLSPICQITLQWMDFWRSSQCAVFRTLHWENHNQNSHTGWSHVIWRMAPRVYSDGAVVPCFLPHSNRRKTHAIFGRFYEAVFKSTAHNGGGRSRSFYVFFRLMLLFNYIFTVHSHIAADETTSTRSGQWSHELAGKPAAKSWGNWSSHVDEVPSAMWECTPKTQPTKKQHELEKKKKKRQKILASLKPA